MKGKVYLVGAGPGDIGLLTIKGLKCLKKAEVVVYDFHLNAQILNYINHHAEFIYAGKRGGHHTIEQEDINKILVQKAKEGKIICRLKGGDPFIFGRGGEEAEVLSKEGIEFEVVPGVSSSIAAPAYAGIPLTHRLYSSSFAVVPGYEDPTKKESSIQWDKLATGVGTIVFLMAVKNIDFICQKLIENGRPPETPTAVIRWGTRADQKTIIGTLKTIPDIIKEKEIKPPAVIVIGEVVKLREHLNWYEKKPLFGQRILITRKYTEELSELEELGAEIIEFPTIEIVEPEDHEELDKCIDIINTYNWLIFTSKNAVDFFFKRFFIKDMDIRDLKGIKICAVGSKTASHIKKYGIKVDIIPEKFNAEGLIAVFQNQSDINRQQTLKGLRFLLPRSEIAREILPEKIKELGGEIDTPITYRTIKPHSHGKRLRRFLKEGKITIATFTSASTFNNFIEIIGDDARELLKGVAIAVIGPVTAKAVENAGFKVSIIPKESTIESMVKEILRWNNLNTNENIQK
jgi:uroporphyrinogen III methyltransferase/synthase